MTSFMKTYVIAKLKLLKTAMQKRNIKASAVWSDQVQVHITVNEELIDWWINLINEDGASGSDLEEIMRVANKAWTSVIRSNVYDVE